MSEELKPCPFCGSRPFSKAVSYSDETGEHTAYWAIECIQCGGNSGKPFVGVHGDDKAEAVEAWNTRADTEAATLRAKLAEAEDRLYETRDERANLSEDCRAMRAALTEARADLDSLRLGRQGLLNELAEAQRVRDCVADERDQARAEAEKWFAEFFQSQEAGAKVSIRARAAEAALRECRELAERDFSDLVIEEIDAYFTQQTQKGTE